MIGIYKITNKINGKVYIGQSINIKQRWKNHRVKAQHDEYPLYRAIRKYGIDNFLFEVIEECSIDKLNEREIYWINYYNALDEEKGYNISSGGNQGRHFTKLNPQSLQEIKDLIVNSDMTLKSIAQKYDVSLITIKDINQGHMWFEEGVSYPLREAKKKQLYYCIDCGRLISHGSKRCIPCKNKAQRSCIRPSREELKNMIRTETFAEIGRKYGVGGNAIKKWCLSMNLPSKKKDIKQYTDEEWELI